MSNDFGGPCIIILAAPSGSGKTTIASKLLSAIPSIFFSVSATTRPPRRHEKTGVHYHFMSLTEFEQHRAGGRLLENEEVYPGSWYGTLVSEVEKSHRGAPVLLDVDVIGAINVKKRYGSKCLALFISPPSLNVLKARLEARGTENEASLQARLSKAENELSYSGSFDHIVINDDLETAVDTVIRLVREFISRSS